MDHLSLPQAAVHLTLLSAEVHWPATEEIEADYFPLFGMELLG